MTRSMIEPLPVPVALEPITVEGEQFQRYSWSIVYGGLKGGIAKTTSTWLTATDLAHRTNDVVLAVCADPLSQTLTTAYRSALAQECEIPFKHIQWPTAEGFVKGVRKEFERVGARHLLIDVGGESEDILEQACILAGHVAHEYEDMSAELMIPTAPSVGELWRLQASIDAAARVEGLSPEPPGVNLLLCKAALRSKRAQETRKYFAHPKRQWPVLRTQIPDNAFYKNALETVQDDGGWYGSVLAELTQDRLEEEQHAS